MAKIATVTLSKASVLEKVFSIERLRATQNSSSGIINMFVNFIKSEDSRSFSTANIKIGGRDDNYHLLYYGNGIRYKVFKDGQVMVSSADTDARFDAQERELAAIVGMAAANELTRCVVVALAEENGIAMGKPKHVNVDDFGRSSSVLLGAMRS